MQNPKSATQNGNDQFSTLAKARSMLHLSVLEATYMKIRKAIFGNKKSLFVHFKFFISSYVAYQ